MFYQMSDSCAPAALRQADVRSSGLGSIIVISIAITIPGLIGPGDIGG
jgi:hypothetical protein